MEDTVGTQGAVDVEGLVKTDKPIITEPDIITLYDTQTGESSRFRVYSPDLLRRKLSQKRPDGSLVFTTVKPAVTLRRGNMKCKLHPDDPNRQHYDELGLPVCKKSNLTNPHQVTQHMKHRHPAEWAAIEAERIEKERQEDRELKVLLMKKNITE